MSLQTLRTVEARLRRIESGLPEAGAVAGLVLRPGMSDSDARTSTQRACGTAAVLYVANLGKYRL